MIIARAPNHLGDGIMALPAMAALARSGPLTIQAPGWGALIYGALEAELRPRGTMPAAEAAVLFPPSMKVAWQARRCERRVGFALRRSGPLHMRGRGPDIRRLLLTDPVEPAYHRSEAYRALVEVLGATVVGPPTLAFPPGDAQVPEGHVGVNPVSRSGAVREWPGMGALAARLKRPVVWYGGPGEHQRVANYAGADARFFTGRSLEEFARALKRCALFVSCDTGAAHLAQALGVPTLVVHGSTTAAQTGPVGGRGVEGPTLACRPCYRQRCRYNLGCFTISVDVVEDAVREILG